MPMSTSRPTSDWTCKKQCRILELPNMHELSVLEENFDFTKSNGPQQSRLPKWSLELKIIFLSKYTYSFWEALMNFCLLTTRFHVWNDLVFLNRWKKGMVLSFSKLRYSETHWSNVKKRTSPNKKDVTPVKLWLYGM